MKYTITLILICFSVISYGQRRRTTATFDADTTRPSAGTYGITVIKNQPYLVPPTGRAQRIDVSPLFIEGRSFGVSNKSVVLDTLFRHFIICGDSVNITLPAKALFQNRKSTPELFISLLGFRGGNNNNTKYTPFDTTFRFTFSDTIFFKHQSSGLTYFTKTFSDDAENYFFKITQPRTIYLQLIENRWYLFYANYNF